MAVIDTILDTPLLYISSFCPHMFSRGTARCQPAFIALPNMLGARTEVATTRSWRKNDPPVSSWLGNLKNFRVYKWNYFFGILQQTMFDWQSVFVMIHFR